jgi:carbon-monoxide dehydrogenase medium subunit
MILAPVEYAAPQSLDEAVALLKKNTGARILGGGHSLLTEMKLQRISPPMLVDLRNIQALRGIARRSDGGLRIGAMTTLVEIAEEKDIQERYAALAEAAKSTSDPQIRNCSTLGGNLAYGDPAADLPAALLVFEATLNIFAPRGTRTIRADEFIAQSLKTGLATDEIITSFDLASVAVSTDSAYEKITNRATGGAICGVAVNAMRASDGTLGACRVAVTGATKHAMRLPAVEAALKGKQPTAETLAAADWVGEEQNFISDLASSAEYRAHLTRVLTKRALTRAIARAKVLPS